MATWLLYSRRQLTFLVWAEFEVSLHSGDDNKAQREEEREEGDGEREVVAPHVTRELGLPHQML